jgi:hypothetical protein
MAITQSNHFEKVKSMSSKSTSIEISPVDPNPSAAPVLSKHETSKGYPAFWHLRAIGMDEAALNNDLPVANPLTVLVLDVNLAEGHPFLPTAQCFTLVLAGDTSCPAATGWNAPATGNVPASLNKHLGAIKHYTVKKTRNDERSDHALGVAALVAGRYKPASRLMYRGAAPVGTKLISLGLDRDPEPMQVIAAFMHACSQNPDIIVVPRDFGDPRTKVLNPDTGAPDASTNAALCSPSVAAAWDEVDEAIKAVSKQIPIVCAAGNQGQPFLVHPARLAKNNNGVIAIGAINALGHIASYSNYGPNLTATAPSSDSETYTKYMHRFDVDNPANYAFFKANAQKLKAASDEYSSWKVLSAAWYKPNELEPNVDHESQPGAGVDQYYVGEPYREAEMFRMFGGTSASSAIAAGVLAHILMQNPQIKKGKDAKAALVAAMSTDPYKMHAPDGASAKVDLVSPIRPAPNAQSGPNGETNAPKSLFFGEGVVRIP